MKDRSKAKKRVALSSLDIHVGWIVGVGVLTVIFLLATFATAYRHDVYSSSLGLRDLVSTDKISKNKARDTRDEVALSLAGWKVITIWECELKKSIIDETLVRLFSEIINGKEACD